MVPNYQVLLLDADDTLFDFQLAERYALGATFTDFAINLPVESYIDEFQQINALVWHEYETGQATAQQIRTKRFVQLLSHLRLDVDPAAVSDSYVDHLGEATFLVEGAMELLAALHNKVRMVLLTNGLSAVQRSRFAKAGVIHYFDAIVISGEVGVQKPDPRVFRIAMERAATARGAQPGAHDDSVRFEDALMVGDNLHSDIAGALGAGMDACWFNYRRKAPDPHVKPTFVIDSLEELLAVVGIEPKSAPST